MFLFNLSFGPNQICVRLGTCLRQLLTPQTLFLRASLDVGMATGAAGSGGGVDDGNWKIAAGAWDGGRSVTLGNWKLAFGGGSAADESFLDVAPFAVSDDGHSGRGRRSYRCRCASATCSYSD